MADPSQGLSIPDDDPERAYSPAEQERLTANLAALLTKVQAGELSDHPVDRALISRLHAALFDGVRSHAGHVRSPGFGSERLTFGPHRSSDRATVISELDRLFAGAVPRLRALESDSDNPEFERSALLLAVWFHAQVIKIHPFEDGNGRVGRALMSVILVRLGLRPIPMDIPKDEYILCLNHYYASNDMQPLIDLCLTLYPA